MRLVLDPGHGGKDPGAVGKTGLQEKTVNLDVALELAARMRARGYEVWLTRSADQYVPLKDRVALANEVQAYLLLSLHVNSSASATNAYLSAHVRDLGGPAERIARILLSTLAATTGWPDGGVFVNNFFLLRESKVPALLLEMGFISNPSQEEWLARSENRKLVAEALREGLEKALAPGGLTFSDIGGHWAQGAIEEAHRLGLVSGYPDGSFRPDQPATRAELAVGLVRMWHRWERKGIAGHSQPQGAGGSHGPLEL
ncbi:MAG: N-acetylmuramoyl-L-alanine amidase [Moorellales bacterium]